MRGRASGPVRSLIPESLVLAAPCQLGLLTVEIRASGRGGFPGRAMASAVTVKSTSIVRASGAMRATIALLVVAVLIGQVMNLVLNVAIEPIKQELGLATAKSAR